MIWLASHWWVFLLTAVVFSGLAIWRSRHGHTAFTVTRTTDPGTTNTTRDDNGVIVSVQTHNGSSTSKTLSLNATTGLYALGGISTLLLIIAGLVALLA